MARVGPRQIAAICSVRAVSPPTRCCTDRSRLAVPVSPGLHERTAHAPSMGCGVSLVNCMFPRTCGMEAQECWWSCLFGEVRRDGWDGRQTESLIKK
jgi:hypothetical protein